MTTPRQRRDTSLSCAECGWRGKTTTPRLAARALSLHSCERTRREAALTARGRARDAAIDRTPKPCLHPRARHEHGHRNTYTLDGCRCLPCCAAMSEYNEWLARQAAYGRDRLVDAAPVRAHIRDLVTSGMGWRQIGREAGVAPQMVSRLLYGDSVAGGPPVHRKRIRPEHATAILAVQPGRHAPGALVDQTGTTRRLQALVAAGWPAARLAQEMGMTGQNFTPLVHGRRRVKASTRDAVTALYERLWAKAPAVHTPALAGGVARARGAAAARGWAPPQAWDDETIDDPAARPNRAGGHDEATVVAWLATQTRPVVATRADRVEVVRRLMDDGFTTTRQLQALTGLEPVALLSLRMSVYRTREGAVA